MVHIIDLIAPAMSAAVSGSDLVVHARRGTSALKTGSRMRIRGRVAGPKGYIAALHERAESVETVPSNLDVGHRGLAFEELSRVASPFSRKSR